MRPAHSSQLELSIIMCGFARCLKVTFAASSNTSSTTAVWDLIGPREMPRGDETSQAASLALYLDVAWECPGEI